MAVVSDSTVLWLKTASEVLDTNSTHTAIIYAQTIRTASMGITAS